MKKKIAFVNKALWYGGIETSLITLLDRMDYEKYDVTLILFRAVFDFDLKERINKHCRLIVLDRDETATFGIGYKYSKLYHFTEPCDNPSWKHKMILWTVPGVKWLENELYIKYAKRMLKNEQFDTVVIYSDAVGEISVRAIKADKYLMFYHHGAMRHVYHEKTAYKKCEKIIAVSENLAEALKEFHPEYKEKVTSIHNLTDVEGIRKKGMAPLEETFDDAKFHIVTVGRVSHEKGMDIAVRVCAKLVEDGFENIRWWIVGEGPAMEEVRNLIAALRMQDYVFTVGRKSNPYPYIRRADLYVQPSRVEGYPMTILEALVLGCAVISTDNPGASEIIKNDLMGILCPLDVKSLRNSIEMIIQNPWKLQKIKSSVAQLDFVKENHKNVINLEKLL